MPLALLKVEFDYDAQTSEELSVREDQLVFVLEKDDPEWYKVKLRSPTIISPGTSTSTTGLVPASYLTLPTPLRTTRALYDYTPLIDPATNTQENEEEMGIREGEELVLWEEEGDWSLVGRSGEEEGVGFVPATYVESTEGEGNPDEIYQDQAYPEPEEEAVSSPTLVEGYVDPSERVAASRSVAVTKVNDVQTWSVTEIDKKKKKKKGTLGVGNGAVFFASESDKTPVVQYSLSTLLDLTSEKSKHLYLSFPESVDLHFTIPSKPHFDEIVAKIESGRSDSQETTSPSPPAMAKRNMAPPPALLSSARSTTNSSNPSSASYIPPPPPIRSSALSPPPPSRTPSASKREAQPEAGLNGNAVALYDFVPQGEDELKVEEGDRLIVVKGGSDDPDWVKVRKVGSGEEGVVPASYVERDGGGGDDEPEREEEEDVLAREEEERLAALDALALRSQLQADAKASRVAAERVEQRRVEQEVNERNRRMSVAPAVAPIPVPTRDDMSRREERDHRARRESGSKEQRDGPKKPAAHRVRTWKDRTGQFKVEAEFLGMNGSKIRLHKLNGVIIEVPVEKMSPEDTAYLKRVTSRSGTGDDDVPLGRSSNQEERRNDRHRRGEQAAGQVGQPAPSSSSRKPTQPKKEIDWFEFFLEAGCDMHDCTRYGNNFQKERMEESILVDLDASTIRTLGLREGDIIRVMKYIREKYGPPPTPDKSDRDARAASEAAMTRVLGNPTPPPPNLFTGPDGTLKSTRRGRPTRSGSNAVDPAALANAGSELARRGAGATSPPIGRVASPAMTSDSMKRSSSIIPQTGGFDDDAWTVKSPSKPTTPAAPTTALPVIAPPPPLIAAPTPPAPTPVQPPQQQQRSGSAGPPTSTLSYNDGLLAQLGISNRPPSAPVPSLSYTSSGGAPAYSPALSFGPRGPVTPVAANQGLLAPLVPIQTGMPRYGGAGLMAQPTGYGGGANMMMPSMTGYPGMNGMNGMGMMGGMQQQQQQPMMPQFTGMPNRNPSPFANPSPSFLQSQPTGMPSYLQPQPTGFQPSYSPQLQQQQPSFNSNPPPRVEFNPLPPQQATNNPTSSTSTSTSAQFTPSNVFANMKGGQDASKYDALRGPGQGFQQGLQPQATGFGMQNQQNQQQQQQQQPIFRQQTGMYQNGQNGQNGYY